MEGPSLAIKNDVPGQAVARCEERPEGARCGEGPGQPLFSSADCSAFQGAEPLPGRGGAPGPPPLLPSPSAGAKAARTSSFIPVLPELPRPGLLVCAEPRAQGQALGPPLLSFPLQPPGDPRGLWGLACPSQSHVLFFPSWSTQAVAASFSHVLLKALNS